VERETVWKESSVRRFYDPATKWRFDEEPQRGEMAEKEKIREHDSKTGF